jgi:hypothetical protein
MPVRVMAWNLQNFGGLGPSYRRVKGTNSSVLAQFVADVVVGSNVDVLAVMEVQESARNSLDNVARALIARTGDTSWMYDWIPSALAITGQPATEVSVTSSEDLSWASGSCSPRREGYAVFWRDQSAGFRMLSAPNDISLGTRWVTGYQPRLPSRHAISLSLVGRKTTTQAHVAYYFGPEAPFDQAHPASRWEPSFYPEVSTGTNPYSSYWELVRRPAYFVLQVGAGSDRDTVWPIQVFHAPSNAGLAGRGTVLAALGRELYVMQQVHNWRPAGGLTYHAKATAAGDYNLNVAEQSQASWKGAYSYYYKPFTGNGAGLRDAVNQPTRSVPTELKLVDWTAGHPDPDSPILKPDLSAYYSRPIDNIFSRDVPGRQEVTLLPQAVLAGGALTGAPVQRFFPLLLNAMQEGTAYDAHRGPLKYASPLIPDIWNWQRFYAGVAQGYFDGTDWDKGTGGARSAAQLIRTFVSDHLPVVVELT